MAVVSKRKKIQKQVLNLQNSLPRDEFPTTGSQDTGVSRENSGLTDLRRQIPDFTEAEAARIIKAKQAERRELHRQPPPRNLCESPMAKAQLYMQRMGRSEAYQIAAVTQVSETKTP